jgi:hypothetical protein
MYLNRFVFRCDSALANAPFVRQNLRATAFVISNFPWCEAIRVFVSYESESARIQIILMEKLCAAEAAGFAKTERNARRPTGIRTRAVSETCACRVKDIAFTFGAQMPLKNRSRFCVARAVSTNRRCERFRSGEAYWVLSQLALCRPYTDLDISLAGRDDCSKIPNIVATINIGVTVEDLPPVSIGQRGRQDGAAGTG